MFALTRWAGGFLAAAVTWTGTNGLAFANPPARPHTTTGQRPAATPAPRPAPRPMATTPQRQPVRPTTRTTPVPAATPAPVTAPAIVAPVTSPAPAPAPVSPQPIVVNLGLANPGFGFSNGFNSTLGFSGGNNLNNFFPLQNLPTIPGMSPTGRFFTYDTVTGSGVVSGSVPIVNRFAGIAGIPYGPFAQAFNQNQPNFNLLPPGVALNVAYNTLPGLPMTQAFPAGGVGFGNPIGFGLANPFGFGNGLGLGVANPLGFGLGNGLGMGVGGLGIGGFGGFPGKFGLGNGDYGL